MNVQDKVVIITGGGRGIGLGLSTAFAKAGAKLVITGRTESTLLDAKKELEAYGAQVLTVTADGADEKAIQNVIEKTVQTYGKIDSGILYGADQVCFCAVQCRDQIGFFPGGGKRAFHDFFRIKMGMKIYYHNFLTKSGLFS